MRLSIPPDSMSPDVVDASSGERRLGHGSLLRRVGGTALRLGVALALLGLLALLAPWGVATAIDILCGVVLVAAGVGQVALSASAFDWRGFWLALLCGLLSLAGGATMLAVPSAGVGAIVLVVGLVLAAEAVAKLAAAWALRDAYPVGWLLFDGLLTAVLAGVLLTARGDDTGTLLGILVGVNLLSSGLTFAATGLTLRRGAERIRSGAP